MVDSAVGTGSDVFDIFQLRPSAVDQTKNFLFHPETSFLQGVGFAHFIIFTVFCKFQTAFSAGTSDGTYAPGASEQTEFDDSGLTQKQKRPEVVGRTRARPVLLLFRAIYFRLFKSSGKRYNPCKASIIPVKA
jgi:hypothetical protein